jgi:hypothetical protein
MLRLLRCTLDVFRNDVVISIFASIARPCRLAAIIRRRSRDMATQVTVWSSFWEFPDLAIRLHAAFVHSTFTEFENFKPCTNVRSFVSESSSENVMLAGL